DVAGLVVVVVRDDLRARVMDTRRHRGGERHGEQHGEGNSGQRRQTAQAWGHVSLLSVVRAARNPTCAARHVRPSLAARAYVNRVTEVNPTISGEARLP